jgi:hypothetical protein
LADQARSANDCKTSLSVNFRLTSLLAMCTRRLRTQAEEEPSKSLPNGCRGPDVWPPRNRAPRRWGTVDRESPRQSQFESSAPTRTSTRCQGEPRGRRVSRAISRQVAMGHPGFRIGRQLGQFVALGAKSGHEGVRGCRPDEAPYNEGTPQ